LYLGVLTQQSLISGHSFLSHPSTGSAVEQRSSLVTQSVMHRPRVSLSASCIKITAANAQRHGANLRPWGLISWTGRLLAGSMAPVAGSGHLILHVEVERASDVQEARCRLSFWKECILLVRAPVQRS
jgi:hypothetical protein